jgi:hypothetical protein
MFVSGTELVLVADGYGRLSFSSHRWISGALRSGGWGGRWSSRLWSAHDVSLWLSEFFCCRPAEGHLALDLVLLMYGICYGLLLRMFWFR